MQQKQRNNSGSVVSSGHGHPSGMRNRCGVITITTEKKTCCYVSSSNASMGFVIGAPRVKLVLWLPKTEETDLPPSPFVSDGGTQIFKKTTSPDDRKEEKCGTRRFPSAGSNAVLL